MLIAVVKESYGTVDHDLGMSYRENWLSLKTKAACNNVFVVITIKNNYNITRLNKKHFINKLN